MPVKWMEKIYESIWYLDHIVILHGAITKGADLSLHMIIVSGFLFRPEIIEIWSTVAPRG